MTPAVAGRVRQLRGLAEHQAACAEFRRHRAADEQARIDALLLDLVHALASLPLDGDSWPNQFTPHPMTTGDVRGDAICPGCGVADAIDCGAHFDDPAIRQMTCLRCGREFDVPEFMNPVPDPSDSFWLETT